MKWLLRVKERFLWLIGLTPMTNREAILEELMTMEGHRFFRHTGLVFNEDVIAEVRDCDYEGWLDRPATCTSYFGED